MDRFSIIEGHYFYYMHYHKGQGSREYQRLSKILTYFTPGLSSYPVGSSYEVYQALCDKNNERW